MWSDAIFKFSLLISQNSGHYASLRANWFATAFLEVSCARRSTSFALEEQPEVVCISDKPRATCSVQ